MSQARTLNEKELKLLLLYIATRKHAARDRAMMLLTHWAGMRIGEVAATKVGDVLALDGTIKQEIRLTAAQTKGSHARTVVLSEKLRKELLSYLQHRYQTKQLVALTYTDEMTKALFATQKRDDGFTANTAANHFHSLYRAAGIDGCSSHSGRRSFITALAAKGVSARVLQTLAGHRSLAVTQHYIDVNESMLRNAVALI